MLLPIAVVALSVVSAPHVTQLQQSSSAASVNVVQDVSDPTAPVVLARVQPKYTAEALRRRIQGSVGLSVLVQRDGSVGQVRVTRSLDAVSGLDAEAVAAARLWRFQPAVDAQGQPVPVITHLDLTFTIRDSAGPSALVPSSSPRIFDARDPAVVAPKSIHTVRPRYTAEALRARVVGTVGLEIVVLPDGTVADARITKSLDPLLGLDEQALLAVAEWTFEPGTVNGQAVPVRTSLELSYSVR